MSRVMALHPLFGEDPPATSPFAAQHRPQGTCRVPNTSTRPPHHHHSASRPGKSKRKAPRTSRPPPGPHRTQRCQLLARLPAPPFFTHRPHPPQPDQACQPYAPHTPFTASLFPPRLLFLGFPPDRRPASTFPVRSRICPSPSTRVRRRTYAFASIATTRSSSRPPLSWDPCSGPV